MIEDSGGSELSDALFEHDMLTAIIMLHEGERGNPVSFDNASAVARALIKEEEELPLHLLRPAEV